MTWKLKITTVGNSTGIVLPRDLLHKLRAQKGDTLFATETPDGVQLTSYDQEFASVVEAADRVVRRYRDALRQMEQ